MDPIERLMDEHRLIESVMDALDAYVDPRNTGASPEDLPRFTTFLREFADACHHGKEEDILFASMVEHGFPRDGGPIAVMLQDHDQGRMHVRALVALAAADTPWSADDRRAIAINARGFTSLLRAHIQKEDQILYPMALRHLPEAALAEVERRFDAFESDRATERRREELVALAEYLSQRYGAGSAIHARAS